MYMVTANASKISLEGFTRHNNTETVIFRSFRY